MNIASQTDIKIRWHFVDRENNDMDFTPVKNVKVIVRHSRYLNTVYEPSTLSIVNGKINFEIPTEELKLPGIYHTEMTGVWDSGINSDGDRKLFVRYLGAFAISGMGDSCCNVRLVSRICIDDSSNSQSVSILNSHWGEITGNIEDQKDLMLLFDKMQHSCRWGLIEGDITEQEDLVELVRYLVKKYAGSSSGGGSDDGDDSGTVTVRASSNDTAMGTVSPNLKTINKGENLTVTATAKTGHYILSWDEASGVVFSGVGDTTGQAYIGNAQQDISIKCNFAKIPEYGISPSSITLTGSGTAVDDISIFTNNGCTIQGATPDGEGSYKVVWGGDQGDYLTIGFEPVTTTGIQKIWVKSTKNPLQERTKTISFVENKTNRVVTLGVIQETVKTYTVTGRVNTPDSGTLSILKTNTPGVVQDGKWEEGYPGFIVNFSPAAGYGMTAEYDGIFDISATSAPVLLAKGNTYQTNEPVKRNYSLLVRASKAATNMYKLTTGTAGTGSGTITSISPSSADGYYAEGTAITLTANNGNGTNDYFSYWLVNGVQHSTRTITVTMDGEKTATAYFETGGQGDEYFTVTTSTNNSAYGTVTGGGRYKNGSTVVLNAIPKAGCQFGTWSGDVSSVQNPHSFVITKDMNIKGNFGEISQSQYTLTLLKNIDGGTVSGAGMYKAGASVEIEADATNLNCRRRIGRLGQSSRFSIMLLIVVI
jgi:hypothetical protein